MHVQVKVTTVDGPVELKIPSGTQPGTTLLMAKRGVPRLGNPDSRGDHQVCGGGCACLCGCVQECECISFSCSVLPRLGKSYSLSDHLNVYVGVDVHVYAHVCECSSFSCGVLPCLGKLDSCSDHLV